MNVNPDHRSAAVAASLARRFDAFENRTRGVVEKLSARIELLAVCWIVAITLLGSAKIAFAPVAPASLPGYAELVLVYGAIALAPVAAWRIASSAYPSDHRSRRLAFHISAIGEWKPLEPAAARQRTEYGPYGLAACLLIGLLLNVALRGFEFFLAVPAVHDAAPGWTRAIFLAMAGDVIAMSFLYMVCFTMALRAVALFPRMLLATWMIDIVMQLAMASTIAAQSDLPADVAHAMNELLSSNLLKVLVSMAIWSPYLLLSDRINLTYRYRVRLR